MAAILGYVLERQFTEPALAELLVTPDGHVLARPAGASGPPAYLAAVADLRANPSALAYADSRIAAAPLRAAQSLPARRDHQALTTLPNQGYRGLWYKCVMTTHMAARSPTKGKRG